MGFTIYRDNGQIGGFLIPLTDGSGYEIRGVDGQHRGEIESVPEGGGLELQRLPGTDVPRKRGTR